MSPWDSAQLAADALCGAILHSLWQIALAAAVYWGLQRARLLGPRTLHDVGCLFIGLLPIAFVNSAIRVWQEGQALPNTESVAAAAQSAATELSSMMNATALTWPDWGNSIVAAVWMLGAALLATRTALGWWSLHRLAANATFPLPDTMLASANALVRELALPRPVRFIGSTAAVVPYTFGWLAPVVVLPMSAMVGLDAVHLHVVLRHELTHVLRRDFLLNSMQCLAETLFFYHPLFWWLSVQVRNEREVACDAEVVKRGVDKIVYARALLALESLRPGALEPAVGATGGTLKMRIHNILKPNPRHHRLSWGIAAIGSALVLAGVFAACSLDAQAPSDTRLDEIRYELGSERLALGDRKGARDAWRELVRHHPQSKRAPAAYLSLADLSFEDATEDPSKLPSAELDYHKALELSSPGDSTWSYATYKLAWVHYRSGNSTESLAHFQKAIEAGDQYPDSPGTLGIAREARRDMVLARAQYPSAAGSVGDEHD